jgi:transcriptional regulator GlxA family with amidase domain
LLKSSFLTIKEVAVRVGVNDVSHFVRDYKALFGQTPSEARRRSQENRVRIRA